MAKLSLRVIILLLGVSLSLTSYADCKIIKIHGTVDRDWLMRDVITLADDDMQGRKNGGTGIEKARVYLTQRFKDVGLKSFERYPDYKQHFILEKWLNDIEGVNILGWIEGSEYPNEFIVVTAHYDHIGMSGRQIFNGADDNASGVAGLLALANSLHQEPPSHSVIFLATDAEEKGLIGANAFVTNPPVDIEQIKVNLNLDMLSQGGFKKRLYVFGPKIFPQFASVFEQSKESAGLCLKPGRQGIARGFSESRRINWRTVSDHGAFYKKDIPFLFVGVNEHHLYHTENDTFENIQEDFFIAAVESSLTILRGLDGLSLGQAQP